MKHNRSLCHECRDVGMCDGQAAGGCDVMNLAEFENTLKDRLAKLDEQFAAMADILKTKKEDFIEMYRKDPRICHDEAVLCLLTNPDEQPDRNAMQEQLLQQQEQMAALQEQLAQQQHIAAEADEMRRQLADRKTQLEDLHVELEQRLEEGQEENRKLYKANRKIQACHQNVEGQLEEEKNARQRLELEKTLLDTNLKELQQE